MKTELKKRTKKELKPVTSKDREKLLKNNIPKKNKKGGPSEKISLEKNKINKSPSQVSGLEREDKEHPHEYKTPKAEPMEDDGEQVTNKQEQIINEKDKITNLKNGE